METSRKEENSPVPSVINLVRVGQGRMELEDLMES